MNQNNKHLNTDTATSDFGRLLILEPSTNRPSIKELKRITGYKKINRILCPKSKKNYYYFLHTFINAGYQMLDIDHESKKYEIYQVDMHGSWIPLKMIMPDIFIAAPEIDKLRFSKLTDAVNNIVYLNRIRYGSMSLHGALTSNPQGSDLYLQKEPNQNFIRYEETLMELVNYEADFYRECLDVLATSLDSVV